MYNYVVTHSFKNSQNVLKISYYSYDIEIVIPDLCLGLKFIGSPNLNIIGKIEFEIFNYMKYFKNHNEKYETESAIAFLLTRIFQYNYLRLCVNDNTMTREQQLNKFNAGTGRMIDFGILYIQKQFQRARELENENKCDDVEEIEEENDDDLSDE